MTDLNYSLDANGLTVPTLQELIDYFTLKYQEIYGNDININSNTPDGQLINIFCQALTDANELIINLYNNMNYITAEGVALDNLSAFHTIKRQAGTYTLVPITITASQDNISLNGLDVSENPFTVADSNGNQYQLLTSAILNTGETTLTFQASNIGEVEVNLNDITNIITPVVGISSVINSSAPLQIGSNEETDASLKQRFLKTYANGGSGSYNNIISALYNVNGVINVQGENNTTNETSIHGTPAHTVWLIIQGGDNEEIANAIYGTISAGCGMRGEQEYIIYDNNENQVIINWDVPSYEDLYIKFTVSKKTPTSVINTDFLKEQLVNNLSLQMNDTIDINTINTTLYGIQDDLIYSNTELSVDGSNYYNIVSNSNLNYIFQLTTNNINIVEE